MQKRIFQGREIIEGSFSWWIKSNDSYVEARCFDVLMMLKDQVLLSLIQENQDMWSSLISLESLGRSFQIEKAKGLAKDFYLNQFKLRFTLCNQLPAAENVYNSH